MDRRLSMRTRCMKCTVRKVLLMCYGSLEKLHKKWPGLFNLLHLSKTEYTEGRAALSKVKHRALKDTIKGLIYVKDKQKGSCTSWLTFQNCTEQRKLLQNSDEEKNERSKAEKIWGLRSKNACKVIVINNQPKIWCLDITSAMLWHC